MSEGMPKEDGLPEEIILENLEGAKVAEVKKDEDFPEGPEENEEDIKAL